MQKFRLKHIIYLLFVIASMGCDDEFISSDTFYPSVNSHYLRISENRFDFYTAFASSKQFDVECIGTSWSFNEVPTWISLSPNSGDKSTSVLLSVKDNLYPNGRTGIFYIQSTLPDWEFSRAILCTQIGGKANLSVDKNNLVFGGGKETQTINVTANCEWEVISSISWLSFITDVKNGTVQVAITPNSSNSYRSGTFYIRYENTSQTIKVIQSPAGIESSVASLEYENVASAYNISIESEADWTVRASDSWIKVTPDKGTYGKTDVSIEVTPNTGIDKRQGYITFCVGNVSKLQIEIVQHGIYLEADKLLEFGSSKETLTLNINSNIDWQVLKSPNWLSLSKTEGTGSGGVLVTASDNPNSVSRTGEIILGKQGVNISYAVQVLQKGKSLDATANVLEFSDKASSNSFRIISDANWKSICSAEWFSSTPKEGSGNANINVSVTENKSSTERTGNIEYKYADVSKSVIISQIAKYLTIDNKVFDFGSKGGTHTIDIATNSRWTAEVEHQVSWLKLSSMSGDGNTQLVLTAEDNPTINVRSAAVIIKSDYSQDVRILVSQQPRTLSISTQKVLFFANGGYSEYIHVHTDGKYKITSDVSWFTVSEEQNNTFRIYAAKNSANDFREGKITITLTDLVDCSCSLELPVVQSGQGSSFITGGFQEDTDWNSFNSGNLSVTVNHYTYDKNWDDIAGGSLKVFVTGYSSDNDWNKNDNNNGRATITGYGEDKNWNE